MISHITLGTNNLEKATSFYSELLSLIGGKQIYQSDSVVFFEFLESGSKLAITTPFNGEAATYGNGTMVAFKLSSSEEVEEAYSLALKLGASSEGKPGPRNDGAYYGAYIRDLDGNKLALFYRQLSA